MKKDGLTLVELIVAMLMGGIIVFTVAVMITDFNLQVFRATARSAIQVEYHIARRFLRSELTEAVEIVSIEDDGIEFLNRDGNTVNVFYDSNEKQIRIVREGEDDILVVEDVVDALFYLPDEENDHLIGIYTDREKVYAYRGEGEESSEQRADTLKLFLRNTAR